MTWTPQQLGRLTGQKLGNAVSPESLAGQVRILLAERRRLLLDRIKGRPEDYRLGFLDGFATARGIVASFGATGHDGDFAQGQQFERERIAERVDGAAADLVDEVGVVPFEHTPFREWVESNPNFTREERAAMLAKIDARKGEA